MDGSKDLGAFVGISVWQPSADNFSYSCDLQLLRNRESSIAVLDSDSCFWGGVCFVLWFFVVVFFKKKFILIGFFLLLGAIETEKNIARNCGVMVWAVKGVLWLVNRPEC